MRWLVGHVEREIVVNAKDARELLVEFDSLESDMTTQRPKRRIGHSIREVGKASEVELRGTRHSGDHELMRQLREILGLGLEAARSRLVTFVVNRLAGARIHRVGGCARGRGAP